MTLTITATAETLLIGGQPHRIWRGHTPQGRPCEVYVRAIGCALPGDGFEFGVELPEFDPDLVSSISIEDLDRR